MEGNIMKIIIAILGITILLSFTGCSSGPADTTPESKPSLSSEQIAQMAARVAWDDQSASAHRGMCAAYNYDPQGSLDQIESSIDPNPELRSAFEDLLNEEC